MLHLNKNPSIGIHVRLWDSNLNLHASEPLPTQPCQTRNLWNHHEQDTNF